MKNKVSVVVGLLQRLLKYLILISGQFYNPVHKYFV